MSNQQNTTAVAEYKPFTLPAPMDNSFDSEEVAKDLEGLELSFPRVKIPGGGVPQFKMPGEDPDHPTYVSEIEGIILCNHDANAYWPEGSEYDDNTPPQCQSMDGKQGCGNPGTLCASCGYNEFGTSGKGKACKNMRMLYILQDGEFMPLQLALPPTSIKPFRNFAGMAFGLRRRPVYGSLVRIALKPASSNGFDYSVATFTRVRDFAGEELTAVKGEIFMFTFPKPSLTGVLCQAHFFTWAQLSEMCSTLLTTFFGRSTPAQAVGETNCGSWSLKLLETALSREDLEVIFTALQADDYERDINDFGEYPVWELSQSLGQKLVSPMLPFVVEESHAADDGVWFTGSKAMYAITVIRQRQDGWNNELYYSTFLIAQNRLPEPSESACETYLRKAICDFLQTEDGKRTYEDTCRDFNWGDVETEIPNEFFAAYGIVHCGGDPDSGKFLCCGTLGILVNQDELLGQGIYDGEVRP